jgi:hypothetical protein
VEHALTTGSPNSDAITPPLSLSAIDRKALCDTDAVSMFKLDFGPADTAERVSMYYRFGSQLTDIRAFADAADETRIFGRVDKGLLRSMQPYLIGEFDSGFTIKIIPDSGETVLRVWGTATYDEALTFARDKIRKPLDPLFLDCDRIFSHLFGSRLSRLSVTVDAGSSNRDAEPLFSIEIPDVLGLEIMELTSLVMPHVMDSETKRFQRLWGEGWRSILFDYMKIRPAATGTSKKYYLSSDYATKERENIWALEQK